MKKLTTTMMQRTLNKQDGRLTIGLDLGDRSSFYCVLDEPGDVLLEQFPARRSVRKRCSARDVVSANDLLTLNCCHCKEGGAGVSRAGLGVIGKFHSSMPRRRFYT